MQGASRRAWRAQRGSSPARPGGALPAPQSLGASRVHVAGWAACQRQRAPRCLTTMDLLLLCILLLFCINKVNAPFKLNAPPGDCTADLASFLHLAGEPGSSSDFNLWLGLDSLLFAASKRLPEGAGRSGRSDPPAGTRRTLGRFEVCALQVRPGRASPRRAGWIKVVPGSAGCHRRELPGPPGSVSPRSDSQPALWALPGCLQNTALQRVPPTPPCKKVLCAAPQRGIDLMRGSGLPPALQEFEHLEKFSRLHI